jgi:hypothetical protein
MKKFKVNSSKSKRYAKLFAEDMRVLQHKISGASVYANKAKIYQRKSKHKNQAYGKLIYG